MKHTINQKHFQKFVFRSVSIPLVVSITLSGIFIWLIFHLMSVNQWVDHSNRVVAQAHEVLQLNIDAETGVRGFLVTEDELFLDPYNRAIENVDAKFAELIDITKDNTQQSLRVVEIQARFNDWKQYGAKAIELKRQKKHSQKVFPAIQGKRIMDDIRLRFDRFIKTEESIRDERSRETTDTVTFILFSILGASAVAGTFLAFYTRKQLLQLSTIYDNALQKQLEQNQELEAQEWLQTGQAELNYAIRGDQSLEELGNNILNYLTQRIDAKVGAVFNLEHGILKRIGAYALDSEAEKRNEIFRIGQGLVGQVAAENKPHVVSNIPDDYMNVTSGTGSTKPKSVVIFPLTVDDEVKAVLELGFLTEVPERIFDFLKLVSENLAIYIRSSEYRTQLASLLEEAQRQSEELQAQQEELRANNEELEEQTNALKESQVRLETQQAELEQTNHKLSHQGRELEHQAQAINLKNKELSETQKVLEQKAKELELSSQYKSQFLANMSHELRTPLNSVLILSQLLMENKRGRLGNEEKEFAKTIYSSSNNLLALINDILDLSKVESGKIELQLEAVPLKDVTQEMSRLFNPVAQTRELQFKTILDPKLPATFTTDRQRLDQILKNLISNALKFTSEGSVTLSISPVNGSSDTIDFSVSDTGIGISADQQEVIFDAFKQADGTTSRKYGGTGLGLTISRDLATLLGGTILVASVPGKGSTFTLRLGKGVEIKKAASIQAEVLPPKKEEPKNVYRLPLPFVDDRKDLNENFRLLLVIEDDTSFAKVLYDLSHEMKFNCIVTQTADEGIEAAQEFLPNAIILDMHLPDHSGLTVLDRLKMSSNTRHIPVYIISAQDPSLAALQMGAIGYLKKPVDLSAVKDAIFKMEEKLDNGIKKVLVVEDNKVQRESIQQLIQDSTVKVVTVEKGADALERLKESSFDCMILDLHLPDMSGFSLLEKMTSTDMISHPPVIVYTGKDLSRDEEEGLQRYSKSIILKGAHSPERLLSEVTLFLHQVETNLSQDRQQILQELRNREKIFENRKILLVDDDVRNIFALTSALEDKGAYVETARNGLEAVKKVESDPEIDLVLMDIMMPEMDGYEAMRRIRKDKRFAKLPIIAVTAKAMADDQEKCREAGANDYLAKPIDLQKLLSLLRVWMPQGRRF